MHREYGSGVRRFGRAVCAALALCVATSAARAQPAHAARWWTHLSVTNGMTPVRTAYYFGPRDPNRIGYGLMGFTGRNGWRPLAQPPQLNGFGAFRCQQSTGEYSHVLFRGEQTYRCH